MRPSKDAGDGSEEETLALGARPGDGRGDVTRLLHRWRLGDDAAQEQLFAVVYGDLRRLAGKYMQGERTSHTLPPTGLVHEAFLRMESADSAIGQAENRRHFFSIAARAMRRILVEHARFHAAARRPSPREAETLGDELVVHDGKLSVAEILAIDEAMDRLKATHARQAQVVEMRYFAGLDESEVAELLGVSRRTVSRDWRVARLMLKGFLAASASGQGTPQGP